MVNIIYKRNCVYQTAYHVIWCPKYRKQVLIGGVADYINSLIDTICMERKWAIITKEIQPDHIHLFLSIPPAVAVSTAVKILKGITARKLFLDYPELKDGLWKGHLWSPSYYVGTAGNVSAETIQRYIDRSEHVSRRR
jgi:putative transposase